jgi:hypothetical protein
VTRRPTVQHRASTAAAAAVQRALPENDLTPGQATAAAAAAVAAAPATQVRRPWRSTVRTLFQLAVGLAPMLPLIVGASGLDETAPAVAGALAISGAVTRVMALPQVEQFLQRFLPWLAAAPAAPRP